MNDYVPAQCSPHEPGSGESRFWVIAERGIPKAIAAAVILGIASSLTGPPVLVLIALTVLWLPIAFFRGLIYHNRGKVLGCTVKRLLYCLALSVPISLPMIVFLLPGLAVNYVIDIGLETAVRTSRAALDATDQIHKEIPKKVGYPWYHPYAWLGYNKVINVIEAIEVPRYTGFARLGLKAVGDVVLVMQLGCYAFLLLIILKTIGYVISRVALKSGMSLLLSME